MINTSVSNTFNEIKYIKWIDLRKIILSYKTALSKDNRRAQKDNGSVNRDEENRYYIKTPAAINSKL